MSAESDHNARVHATAQMSKQRVKEEEAAALTGTARSHQHKSRSTECFSCPLMFHEQYAAVSPEQLLMLSLLQVSYIGLLGLSIVNGSASGR